jgi:hypothetical protein
LNESFVLKDVSVSNLQFNLLSVSQLLEKDFKVHFKKGLSVLDDKKDLIYRIPLLNKFFMLIFPTFFVSSRCLVARSSSQIWNWHKRLGSLSFTFWSD